MAFFNGSKNSGSGSPSTPIKSRDFASHLSTTPVGPPPSSALSFTPEGPPPSSVLGSSYLGRGSQRRSKLSFSENAFDQSANSEDQQPEFAFSTTSSNFHFSPQQNQPSPNTFAASQPFDPYFRDSVSSTNVKTPPKFGATSDAVAHEPQASAAQASTPPQASPFTLNSPRGYAGSPYPPSMLPSSHRPFTKPLIYSNPNNAKRAKLDESWVKALSPEKDKDKDKSKKRNSPFSAIARDLAERIEAAELNEPSTLILDTEDVICRMYDQVRESDLDRDDLGLKLSDVSSVLLGIWRTYAQRLTSPQNFSVSGGIGPGESAPGAVKASFLSSLLVALHHPPLAEQSPRNAMSSSGIRAPFRALAQPDQPKPKSPIPRVLFQWINFYHSPQIGRIETLRATQPNPTSSAIFWDIILSEVLRANFSQVAHLLDAANFNYARSALEDGYEHPGYHGAQLQNIQRCVNKASQLLRSAPGMEHDDWDIKGLEWAMFRKKISSAIAELEDLAEGGEPVPTQESEPFEAQHFGISSIRSNGLSFSQSARMADSKVPWTIYQNLKAMYNIIAGDVAAIVGHSLDWVEATVGLVAWWDGDDDNDITLKRTSRRASTKRLNSQTLRSVDSNPEEAYLRRLDYTFSCVTDTDTLGNYAFQVNSMNHLEVGLASVFEGNVDGTLQLLRTWSLPVSSAVAEVASFGGWLETAAGAEPLPGFNESDLMVLNYGQRNRRLRKDDLLTDYASAVFGRPRLEGASEVREGWEISLEVLSRLDDQDTMTTQLNEYLDRVELDSSNKMDKMVLLCTELGFREQARKVSERYGDKVAESSGEYGTSLFCYARAHCAQKIKNIIDLLISFSLIQSRAYPPTSSLDAQFRTLLYDPKTALAAVASVDVEAATMLQFYFSGYAALRSFYETRDEEMYLENGQAPKRRPLARKKAAAESLVAVVGSAADSIYGGLYDPERKTAVQVDGLLVLLAEVLALSDPDTSRFFNKEQQLTILAAIEDLQTVTPRVYDQCEECLQAAVYHHSQSSKDDTLSNPAFPRNLLKKSVSSATTFSGFSLVGSEMLESQSRSHSGIGDSGVLVPHPEAGRGGGSGQGPSDDDRNIQRGWDWRTKISRGMKGEDVLRALRLKLAKALSLGAYQAAS